jgi:uncharacterized protein (DUF2249 family)
VARTGKLVLDIRSFDPAYRRPVIFCVIDMLCGLECPDEVLLITDHEPSAIGYQIDLRKETRGRVEFTVSQRSDGAWVGLLTPKRTSRVSEHA